ncbi:hypothetical protein Ahy_A06g028287 [Arachis hypogaea]|uniref:Uncharacterized protein n=1 Tax=Arachis hypogaea TaxID=3818 RepID=A0A445CQX3_ARAHY|nr:hypothetical protein Ahy_A06g028287 [Arachis hypogaea]
MLPHNKTDWNLVPEKTYQVMKANVDALKIIQLGLTLSYEHGNLPDLGNNNKTQNSLLLAVQYPRLQPHLAAASGLLLNKALTWVTFHGAYDIGYLVKILTWGVLPTRLEEFLELVKELFGRTTYDVKHVMSAIRPGLTDRVVRQCHQAGSDSVLTCHTFHKIREIYFLANDDGFREYVNQLPLLEPSPSLIDKYQFVSIDTEFSGVVIQSRNKNYRSFVTEETYQVMKANPRIPKRLPPLEPSPNSSVVIRRVWAANADSEFQYQFVSIDTEFLGVVILARNQNYRNLVP